MEAAGGLCHTRLGRDQRMYSNSDILCTIEYAFNAES
jgi:hypothetical protein